LLLGFLTEPALREHAADCLHDIINKGMEPIPKLELVESLVQLLEETGVLIFEEVNDENVDFQAKMSRLYNGIGNSLIVSYNKLLKNEDEINAQLVLDAIYRKVPYMLRYLVSEYDDVSENVIPFATQYVTVLKHLNLSDDNRQSLQVFQFVM
jgi:exportin-T